MRIVAALAAALTAAATASGSLAAHTQCKGEGEDATGRVQVVIEFDRLKETNRWASWTPTPTDATADHFPWLDVTYALSVGELGAPTSVRVLAMVSYDPPVHSRHAAIVVQAGGGFWRRRWRMLEDNIPSGKPGPDAPKGSKPAAFVGNVPIAFAGSGTDSINPDLLAVIDKAPDAQVSVEGDAGETFGRHSFNLSDHAARDRLLAQALARATTAAASPAACPVQPKD